MNAVQKMNAEMIALLSAIFQKRREPNFAWKSACAAYLALPGLRAFYPMSAVGVAGQAQDIQSLGNHLTRNGIARFGYTALVPYCNYNGIGAYHDITDAASGNAFDILGTETAIVSTVRGLTLGYWCRPEETGTLEYLLSKWGGVGNRAYRFFLNVGNQFNFSISDDGTNFTTATSVAITTFNTWYYIVGRFNPSTTVDIFVNGVEVNQATARASIFNSSANFTIAAQSGGTNPFQGRKSMVWMCAAQLSNAIIRSSFEQTRAMYGV